MTDFAEPDTQAAEDTGGFLDNDELIGRNVIIVPKEIETIKGEGFWPDGREKTDYQRITADIIVLDGRQNPKIVNFPHIERDKFVSSFKIVAELRKYVGSDQPVLGYWTKVGNGFFLEPADKNAVKLAQEAWPVYAQPPF
jgi:hypothetical protein